MHQRFLHPTLPFTEKQPLDHALIFQNRVSPVFSRINARKLSKQALLHRDHSYLRVNSYHYDPKSKSHHFLLDYGVRVKDRHGNLVSLLHQDLGTKYDKNNSPSNQDFVGIDIYPKRNQIGIALLNWKQNEALPPTISQDLTKESRQTLMFLKAKRIRTIQNQLLANINSGKAFKNKYLSYVLSSLISSRGRKK